MKKIITILILGVGLILMTLLSWANFQLNSYSHAQAENHETLLRINQTEIEFQTHNIK